MSHLAANQLNQPARSIEPRIDEADQQIAVLNPLGRSVVLYAVAMAWVESAVVFYLRTMIDRIEPYQPDPLPVIGGFAPVELSARIWPRWSCCSPWAFSRAGRGGRASVMPPSPSACGTFFITSS